MNFQQVKIGYHSFQVEVADGPDTWAKGLMFRPFLPKHRGMLFVFPQEDIHVFWMKNTQISLDMIWIGQNDVVAYVHSKAIPFDETMINPKVKARYVLEIRGGLASDYNIKVGDTVRFVPSINRELLLK